MTDDIVKYDDGFGTPDRRKSPIKGTLIKFGVDGVWRSKDGLTVDPNLKLVAMGTIAILQCWQDKKPVDTIYETPGQPLPDANGLNAQIPRSEWPIGVSGEPQGPWQLQRLLYLLDPVTAQKFTFATGTIGGAIAISDLKECVNDYRRLQGEGVCAVVALATAPFKTKYGMKTRPSLKIVGWHHFGDGGGGQSLLPAPEGNGGSEWCGREVRESRRPRRKPSPKRRLLCPSTTRFHTEPRLYHSCRYIALVVAKGMPVFFAKRRSSASSRTRLYPSALTERPTLPLH